MLRRAWTEHRWLTLLLGLSLIAVLIIAIRLVLVFDHHQRHSEPTIQPWMTLRYVARSYGAHGNSVFGNLRTKYGLERGNAETIAEIAARNGVPEHELVLAVALAIRNSQGGK